MTFSLSYLQTPPNFDFNSASLALWLKTLMPDDGSPNYNFTTQMDPKPPHLSGRTFWSSAMEGPVLYGPMEPAVLGTAVSQPTSPHSLPESGALSQQLWLQEATAQSPAFWAELLTPPYLSYAVSHHGISQDHLGKWGAPGVSSHCSLSPGQNSVRASPFVCLISIFHCTRCRTSRDRQHKKEITWFGLTLCY